MAQVNYGFDETNESGEVLTSSDDVYIFPASFAQQRLWFLQQLDPRSSYYNISIAIRLTGSLNVEALSQSFNEIVRRHETLRTTFTLHEGQPVQVICEFRPSPLPLVDLTGVDAERSEALTRLLASEEAQRYFDLEEGPLMRPLLLCLSDREYVALLTMHHVISDGWSTSVLVEELGALYASFSNNLPSPLPDLPIQYADFAVWQRDYLQGERLERLLDYWKSKLGGDLPNLNLPTDRPRPALQTHRGSAESVLLPPDLVASLNYLSNREGVTLFVLLLAAFQALLHRHFGNETVLVGTPIANRTRMELEGLIGVFINTLVMRADFPLKKSFRQLLAEVKETALGAYAHQDLPFEKLVDELQPERSLSRSPLFEVMFAMQNTPRKDLELSGLRLCPFEYDSPTTKFSLHLTAVETAEGLIATLAYNTDLFEANTIVRLLSHFEILLGGVATNPQAEISALPLLSTSELSQLLYEWNDTRHHYREQGWIHQMFEKRAEQSPTEVAVVFDGEEITCGELNRKANKLAHYLRKLGVGPESLVGIYIERSLEMMIGLLGVLKAGGAYVPLESEYPADRFISMFEASRPKVLLTEERYLERLSGENTKAVCLDRERGEIKRESEQNPLVEIQGDNLAYVIFTSGSTGRPKGVMNTHRAIANRLLWMQEKYSVTKADRILQKTPFSFDVSVWELFLPLLSGARLVMAKPGGHRDDRYLRRLIRQQGITTIHFVPSMLQAFLEGGADGCESLVNVISSGEPLSYELKEKFYRLMAARLHNLYGPTEAAVDVTSCECHAGGERQAVPIGKPIFNIQIHILDGEMRPVPVGVAGEIYIGGTGLARGYLNQPDLTGERFLPNPVGEKGGELLYKTGDLGRYWPDGNIEHLGRIDSQVKIRGFRIELGEVETVLSQHPAVQEAVVSTFSPALGDNRLVAYVAPDQSCAPVVRRLLRFDKEKRLASHPRYELPNGTVIIHNNENETGLLYARFFEWENHLWQNIETDDGGCIFDVSANIGLSPILWNQVCRSPTIYAFEPLPPLFEILEANAELHGLRVNLFRFGLGRERATKQLTFIPQCTIFSGQIADGSELQRAIVSFFDNYLSKGTESSELLAGRRFDCELKSLSDVISENHVERIDLLKIGMAVNGIDVLEGVSDTDWQKIERIIVEAIDAAELVPVTSILNGRGYKIHSSRGRLFDGVDIHTVYAAHNSVNLSAPHKRAAEAAANSNHHWQSPASLIKDLRGFITSKLPDYMVPAAFVLMDKMPLTPNGKVDHRALPAPDTSKNELQRSYQAPRNKIEQVLADIWSSVLKIERVSIHDNFFELGGDSILSIQIVSKASQRGVRITPRQMFEHQTIAELGDAARVAEVEGSQQGRVEGEVPLTPIQEWFFEQELEDRNHWNQAVLLECEAVSYGAVARVMAGLVEHHDGLRMRYRRDERGVWRQHNAGEETNELVSKVDLGEVGSRDEVRMIERVCEQAHRSLDLERGPVIRAVVMGMGEGRRWRMQIVAHHLVVDGVSWRVMLEDMEEGYEQAVRGEEVSLGEKTASYKRWAEALREYAESERMGREKRYWMEAVSVDERGGEQREDGEESRERDVEVMRGRLSEEETRRLLQEVPGAYHTQINEVLLVAVMRASVKARGSRRVKVEVEGHGREVEEIGEDVTRTVGWFTSKYIVEMEGREGEAIGEQMKRVKEQVRAIPGRGIGYGVLRYLAEDEEVREEMKRRDRAEMSFNYLGQLGWRPEENFRFAPAKESHGSARSPRARRVYPLTINAGVHGGQLHISLIYCRNVYRRHTMERFVEEMKEALLSIIEHCKLRKSDGIIPSDFPLMKVNQKQLNKILAKIQK